MRKFATLVSVLMLYCMFALAQTRTVTGKVVDAGGDPVPFATIKIKGKDAGTSADLSGNFSINVNTGDVLVISSTQIATTEFTIGTENDVRIQTTRLNADLSEVVVTALGVKREKKSLGYAVQE